MKGLLNELFDFQRFESNGRLDALIQDTKKRFNNALSDEDLEGVSAAEGAFFLRPLDGSFSTFKKDEKK